MSIKMLVDSLVKEVTEEIIQKDEDIGWMKLRVKCREAVDNRKATVLDTIADEVKNEVIFWFEKSDDILKYTVSRYPKVGESP
jgi:hypothetical protein